MQRGNFAGVDTTGHRNHGLIVENLRARSRFLPSELRSKRSQFKCHNSERKRCPGVRSQGMPQSHTQHSANLTQRFMGRGKLRRARSSGALSRKGA